MSFVEAIQAIDRGETVKKKFADAFKYYGLSHDGQRIFGWWENVGPAPVPLHEMLEGDFYLCDEKD